MALNVFRSKLPSLSFPTGLSIPAFFRANLDPDHGPLICQVCAETGVEYSYNQVIDHGQRFANALVQLQTTLKRGSRIALYLEHIPEYLSIVLGALDAGLVTVHLNPNYSEHELQLLLEKVQVSALICTSSTYERTNTIFSKFGIGTIFTVGANEHGHRNYFDLIKTHEPLRNPGPCNVDDTAMILFSSGTTGLPKGAALSHKNLIMQVLGVRGVIRGIKGRDVMFSVFSGFNIGGVVVSFISFDNKWKNVTWPGRHSKQVLSQIIKKYKPNIMWGPPTLCSMLCAIDDLHQEDFVQVKTIICGGMVFSPALLEKMRALIGPDFELVYVYGCSETAGVCTASLWKGTLDHKEIHAGSLIPTFQLKIIDLTDGDCVGVNQKGEICVRGPMIFKGYVNNEEANLHALKDGWFHTGDLGYLDTNENLHITGRIKELIKVHGYQVSPAEIEDAIRKHPLVEEVVVFGVPHEKSLEAPRAWIIRKSETLQESQVHEFLKDKLVYYKQLRGGIRFVNSIPTSPGAPKLNRKAAKEMDATMEVNSRSL